VLLYVAKYFTTRPLTGAKKIMQNDAEPHINAFHYIIVGVFGLFAGSFAGFLLCAATQGPGSEPLLILWPLWGAILGAAGLPILLRASSH
jgi:hypothetical protein